MLWDLLELRWCFPGLFLRILDDIEDCCCCCCCWWWQLLLETKRFRDYFSQESWRESQRILENPLHDPDASISRFRVRTAWRIVSDPENPKESLRILDENGMLFTPPHESLFITLWAICFSENLKESWEPWGIPKNLKESPIRNGCLHVVRFSSRNFVSKFGRWTGGRILEHLWHPEKKESQRIGEKPRRMFGQRNALGQRRDENKWRTASVNITTAIFYIFLLFFMLFFFG